MVAMDEYLEKRWNHVLSLLNLTNSKDMVFAKPPTEMSQGVREGEGVKFMGYVHRHVSQYLDW